MSELQTPNTDQASSNSMGGKMRDVLSRWLRDEVDDMLPAVVTSYDDQANMVTVRPLVMVGTTDGQKVSRSVLPPIPVFRFGGGDFFIRFPIKPGNFGWVKANDRDVSLVIQRGGAEDWPNTTRLHSFSDGMFFPHSLKDWVLAEEDADAAVFQSLDGVGKLAIHADKVVLAFGENAITLDATGILQQAGASSIYTTTAGVAIVSATLTHNGVNIGDTHRHDGVTPGPGNTGEPI